MALLLSIGDPPLTAVFASFHFSINLSIGDYVLLETFSLDGLNEIPKYVVISGFLSRVGLYFSSLCLGHFAKRALEIRHRESEILARSTEINKARR